MTKISILTATRAEYGLLKPVMKALMDMPELDVSIVVTGAHLSPEFGLTYQEIEQDGIVIDKKIEILVSADSPAAISKSMGLALISFADYFASLRPEMLLVLGDRYETLAVCIAAMNQRIPIAHLYGGEATEGVLDEAIRHAITKISYLHFTSTEDYRKRVIQMGEHPSRVFCVGALGIENILKQRLMEKGELEESIHFMLDKPYAVVTFHPVTLEEEQSEVQFQELLGACNQYPELIFIFTKANADVNGRIINNMIDAYVEDHKNAIAFASLGVTRYLSALQYAAFVLGNSSSGIIEAPSFGIPTINIGDRQKGRIQSDSVIDCATTSEAIKKAIDIALSDEFRAMAKMTVNPYGNGNTTGMIVKTILDFLNNSRISLKKNFYDVEVK